MKRLIAFDRMGISAKRQTSKSKMSDILIMDFMFLFKA